MPCHPYTFLPSSHYISSSRYLHLEILKRCWFSMHISTYVRMYVHTFVHYACIVDGNKTTVVWIKTIANLASLIIMFMCFHMAIVIVVIGFVVLGFFHFISFHFNCFCLFLLWKQIWLLTWLYFCASVCMCEYLVNSIIWVRVGELYRERV